MSDEERERQRRRREKRKKRRRSSDVTSKHKLASVLVIRACYPGPLLEVELESACLSGQGCGLCIALIRPNHWAASVAQWLEHLSSKQCVVGSNPTRAALFSFRRKKSCLG